MKFADKRVLVQYSGGKDSTACLIKLLDEGAYVEAIHFIHEYAYELPTSEAKRICEENNITIHIIDITQQLHDLFLNEFDERPCRFCKGIMDSMTVDMAVKYCFDYICVGDTASDKTLVERIKANGETNLLISRYFNKSVELPEQISIVRPLIFSDNEDVFQFLDQHSINIKRNNDTGDKYFDYSREGCPLQFKDFGVSYTKDLMKRLKVANTLCSEFATINNIKASIHLPSEEIVTIPKGYEEQCRKYLFENEIILKERYDIKTVKDVLCFSISVYKEILCQHRIVALFTRFLERMSETVTLRSGVLDYVCICSENVEIDCKIIKNENIVIGNIRSLKNIDINFIESLFVELFHTYNFDIKHLSEYTSIMIEPLIQSISNCRYVADDKLGNRFIRSSCIDEINIEDIVYLSKIGVSTIIDLRNETKSPDTLIDILQEYGMYYCNLPFTSNNFPISRRTNKVADIVDSYLSLLESSEDIKSIFKTIAEAPGTVLLFCKYGKDRTGVVSMILEALNDVSKEVIIKDYILSDLLLNKDKYYNQKYDYSSEIPIRFITEFNKKYKSAFDFLLSAGLEKEEIFKIIEKMR